MHAESDREYHIRRARNELDRAYRAPSYAASSAHFLLSALHMARLRVAPAANDTSAEPSPEPVPGNA